MSEANSIQRPRTGVLLFAAVALAGVLAYTLWPAAPQPAPSNPPREQRPQASAAGAGPLDVRLDDLKQPPPEPGADGRNPFRFYVKPPPPPPPPPKVPGPGDKGYVAPTPPPPPPPPGPPPIPLKYIGIAEQGTKKVAVFSDGRGVPLYAAEGELVLGQYRVVKIQLESVVMEYADGKGRQTIPMRGQ